MRSSFQEGKACVVLGGHPLMNPYRNEINRLAKLNIEADSALYELANDWDSGYSTGG